MYLKLALRNAKRSIGDYILYMMTMIILIVIMTISNCIAVIGMQADFQTISLPLLISLILVILTGYINGFMLKQRSKEFANYLLLGMEKGNLLRLFFTEFVAIGLACFVIGGLVCSGIYLMFTVVIFKLDIEIQPFFLLQSLVQTFFYFCVIELFSMFQIGRSINKLQIRELMIEKKRNQKLGSKRHLRFWGVAFVTSLFSLLLLFFCSAFLCDDVANIITSIIVLPLTFAVFAFYKWLFQFLAEKRVNQSETLYRKNRLYIVAKLTSEGSAIMNSVFCLCLIFSMISFIFGVIMLQPGIEIFDVKNQQWMGFLQISLCIIFTVIYFSILSLQQIIEFKQAAKAFQILHFMGKTREQIRALVKVQVQIKLLIPTVMYFILLPIVVPLLNYKLNLILPVTARDILIKSVFWFLGCLLVLYLCYLFIVIVTTKQYVENAVNTKF